MFSFFKKKNQTEMVPEWASFFNQNQYGEFIRIINNYFESKKVAYEIEDGIVKVDDESFGFEKLGLLNVAQMCKQFNQRNWTEIITDHFENLIKTRIFEKEFNQRIDDFDYVKTFLGVRLYHKDYAAHIGREMVVGKEITEDLFAMLIFDFPHSIINVSPNLINKWNVSLDKLFDLGINNIKNNYPLEISEQKIGEFKIWFIQGEHFFTPNVIFDFDNHTQLIGSKGSLIGLPHRHSILIYPIESLEVINAINTLIPIVSGMNSEGPGALSEKLYWYYNGEFIDLPYSLENKKLQFFPPERFINLLNEMKG